MHVSPIPPVLDDESLLIGFVGGNYIAKPGAATLQAILGLYLNKVFHKSAYSFCCFSKAESRLLQYYSPFDKDEPIERALLEGWSKFDIVPHLWSPVAFPGEIFSQAEETLRSEYQKRSQTFENLLKHYKKTQKIIDMVYQGDRERYQSERLFYPDPTALD